MTSSETQIFYRKWQCGSRQRWFFDLARRMQWRPKSACPSSSLPCCLCIMYPLSLFQKFVNSIFILPPFLSPSLSVCLFCLSVCRSLFLARSFSLYAALSLYWSVRLSVFLLSLSLSLPLPISPPVFPTLFF